MTESNIQQFFHAYVTTALWSSTDESRDDGGDAFDQNYDQDDIAPEAITEMESDCRAFLAIAGDTISTATTQWDDIAGVGFDKYGRAGHDFWLTRNGHGAGFWDGDWPENEGSTLTDMAEKFGEVNLYLGDDGAIYIS